MMVEVSKKLGPALLPYLYVMGVLHWASYGAGLAALLFITLSLGV
jgi:hypothetical protein